MQERQPQPLGWEGTYFGTYIFAFTWKGHFKIVYSPQLLQCEEQSLHVPSRVASEDEEIPLFSIFYEEIQWEWGWARFWIKAPSKCNLRMGAIL